jgi:hypothetical protein
VIAATVSQLVLMPRAPDAIAQIRNHAPEDAATVVKPCSTWAWVRSRPPKKYMVAAITGVVLLVGALFRPVLYRLPASARAVTLAT